MRVLVVEDDNLAARNLTAELEEAGYRVIGPACSSGEAIVLARSRCPSIALVDIDLESEGAGILLAQRLCTEFGVRVLFMTEHKTPARANASYAIGMIAKPFDFALVPEILRCVSERVRTGQMPSMRSCPLSFEPFEREGA